MISGVSVAGAHSLFKSLYTMSTDYVLFVHGVKTHNQTEFHRQTKLLLDRLQGSIPNPVRDVKAIPFFWGDLSELDQNQLRRGFEQSPHWSAFWFQKFRSQEILEFVGDAALYLSRHVGSEVVKRLKQTLLTALQDAEPNDRLHLVTHSWGTVILFDILFAARWEDPRLDVDVREAVKIIRNVLFGLGQNQAERSVGIPIASIHTMGSPIALFSLLSINSNANGDSSHDLAPELTNFLECLYKLRQKPIPWFNFAHPGDPIAYPLQGVMTLLLDDSAKYVDLQDVITEQGSFLMRLFSQTLLPLLRGGDAHGSYWTNEKVVKTINAVMQSAV